MRHRRKQLDVKQLELAYRAGVTQQHISAIESGKTEPMLGLAFKIAKALDTSVDSLLGFDTANGGYRTETLVLRERVADYEAKLKKVTKILGKK